MRCCAPAVLRRPRCVRGLAAPLSNTDLESTVPGAETGPSRDIRDPGDRPAPARPARAARASSAAAWSRMTAEDAKPPTRLPPDCDTPPVRPQGPIWPQGNEHRSKCLANVHANQPLTPSLRRIDRQQSIRWGKGAARWDRSQWLTATVAATAATNGYGIARPQRTTLAREVALDPGATADTPVRNHGPGRSLPGPDAGHPLQGAGGHGESSMIRNIRGMILTAGMISNRVLAGRMNKFERCGLPPPEP